MDDCKRSYGTPSFPRQLLLIYNFVIRNIAFIDEGQVDVMETVALAPGLE